MSSKSFFRKSDWIACLVTFVISLAVYVFTLQPTVGLEDSGELIVASDYLGVPHPPGYPIWSLLTWFFQWVFHAVSFHGHPNPAWAVNLFSAVSGAAACGALALLISRSGMDLLRSLKKESSMLGEQTESLFCAAAGISGGLLLAFGQGMWSQAVIAEVYTLNIFFQSLMLVFLYRWVSEPKQAKWLMLCAFTFGLGITNHQTLMFMGLAIAIAVLFNDLEIFSIKNLWQLVGAFVALSLAMIGIYFGQLPLMCAGIVGCVVACLLIEKPYLVRDFVITGVLYLLLVGFNKWAATSPEHARLMWIAGPENPGFWIWTLYAILVPVLATFALPNGKIVGPTFLLMFIGLAFYLYMPVSSDQNPPINWGYPRTWQGFMHAVTRGQYERVKLAAVFTPRFLEQVGTYLTDLRSQFYWPIALLGLVPLAAFPVLRQQPGSRFNLDGRISRFSFFFWTTSSTLLAGLIILLLIPSLSFSTLVVFHLLASALICFPVVKRLHDIGRGGMLYWGMYIPLVNIAGYILLWALRGTEGDNEYGPNPQADETADLCNRNSAWLLTTLVAFLSVGIVFMILQNPKTDIQSLFIGRVQYIQSHAIYVTWLGYAILLLMASLETLVQNNKITKIIGVAAVLLLPFALIYKNYFDKGQLKVYGGAEQTSHDFGWQFGNWQLEGVKGIEQDMRYWYSEEEFEKLWAEYPDKSYPPPMGTNAIFFGGTDPGRFVPTYMIYSAKVRQDVYLITQNALADNTYMSVMRDLYGDQIWIPSPTDNNLAFQKYVDGVRSGKINAGADVSTEGGKVQVQGVAGVMKINGFLSKMIFDHNQYRTETKTDEKTRPVGSAAVYDDPPIDPSTGLPPKRTFYVEESHVLEWMYPYLTPHGLIMKINNKKTPLSDKVVKQDTDFWNWYTDRLLNDDRFLRDIVARKSFCKLRTSLAGLYAARGKPKEAEAAFRQAIALYDLSPEANFRLANLIIMQDRFEEAIELFNDFIEKDPNNSSAVYFRENLLQRRVLTAKRKELEKKLTGTNTVDFNDALNLAAIYLQLGHIPQAESLAGQILSSPSIKPEMITHLAEMMVKARRFEMVEKILQRFTQLQPNQTTGWIDLAAVQLNLKKPALWASLKKAIQVGGEDARNKLRKDKRFNPLRNLPEFQALVPPVAGIGTLNPLPGF